MLKIFSVCYNTPIFVKYQYLLLKKFLKNDFKYIIYDNTCTNINDGKIFKSKEDLENRKLLETICNELVIDIVRIPEEIYSVLMPTNTLYYPNYDVSTRAGSSISFACDDIIKKSTNEDIIFLIDSDMFLIKELNFDYLGDFDIFGIPQNREHINYFTNQLFIFRLNNISKDNIKYINFYPRNIDNIDIDCGADLHFLKQNQPNLKYKNFKNFLFGNEFNLLKSQKSNKDFFEYLNNDLSIVRKTHRQDIGYHGELYNGIFFHFRAGSNWREGMKYSERTINLFSFLEKILY
jgi:hypothetical protein